MKVKEEEEKKNDVELWYLSSVGHLVWALHHNTNLNVIFSPFFFPFLRLMKLLDSNVIISPELEWRV